MRASQSRRAKLIRDLRGLELDFEIYQHRHEALIVLIADVTARLEAEKHHASYPDPVVADE